MNRIQRNKLHLSKWTAVQPVDREKHFLVTRVIAQEGAALQVVLEAVHSKRVQTLPWTALKDSAVWRQGWH